MASSLMSDQLESRLDVPAESPPRKGRKKRDGSGLRKAPQAPKRFKSSYICFFMDKQPEIKEMLGDKATVAEVSKRSAELWRNLSSEERAHWDEIAAKDKQRYMVEKATYTGPWQVPWKRAKKDPTAPKRPMSAFLYFSQAKRRSIKEEYPNLRNTEISRKLGELWRMASDEERAPHIQKEKVEREKYKVQIAEWRKKYEKKMEDQRKAQADQAAQMTATMYSTTPVVETSASSEQPTQLQQQLQQLQYSGYDPTPMAQQASMYLGQQPPARLFGSYQSPYAPAYPSMSYYASNPNYSQASINGRSVMVLGPNGMPHYQPYSSQDQSGAGQSYDGVSQGQYDDSAYTSQE